MQKKVLEGLLAVSGTPCLSLIIPTHRLQPERVKDESAIRTVCKQAEKLIENVYGENSMAFAMKERLLNLIESIDYVHMKEGLGVYITPNSQSLIPFPFPVIQKIKLGDKFDSRDLLYYNSLIGKYGVLSISKRNIQLYEVTYDNFSEITNEDFPYHMEDTYEYSRPVRAHSFGSGVMKEFEKDKSVIEEIRLKDTLRTVENMMGKHIAQNTPLLVAGGAKEINDYLEITKNKKRIVGKITGNYNFEGEHKLATLAMSEMQKFRQTQHEILIANFKELIGMDMVAVGIEEVWDAATQGNAMQLIIEKDFECAAYIKDDGSVLKINTPALNQNYHLVTDAAERVINLVRSKGGIVFFLNNNTLKEFGYMALQLRYNPGKK